MIFSLSGSAINRKEALQCGVALSTTEVEYVKITEAMKEAIWFQGLERTKHMVVKHHFIRNIVT